MIKFWEEVLINYLSTVFSGITLALLGIGAYKIYKTVAIKINQKSKYGDNTTRIIENITINVVKKDAEKIIEKLIK